MKLSLLPLALFIAAAQAQIFILGALAAIEFTLEVLEAGAVVAEIDVSVDAAITGAEAAETAGIQAEISNVATAVTRQGAGRAVELEGHATLTAFTPRVNTVGPGFTQGTFFYKQDYPIGGLGRGGRNSVNPQVTFNWGAQTMGFRNGGTTHVNFRNPQTGHIRITNPGAPGTTVRMRGPPRTKLLSSK